MSSFLWRFHRVRRRYSNGKHVLYYNSSEGESRTYKYGNGIISSVGYGIGGKGSRAVQRCTNGGFPQFPRMNRA